MPTVPVLAATVSVSDSIPNVLNAPPAYTRSLNVSFVVSGAQSLRTERFVVTLVNASGESAGSAEYVIQVPANNVVLVQSPEIHGGLFPNKATGWNLYATAGASGAEKLQNTAVIVLGQSWQEVSTGLTTGGAAYPTTASPLPGYTANNSLIDSPPVTGAITVPQSPAGTSVTNTGRSTTATQTYLSQFKIS